MISQERLNEMIKGMKLYAEIPFGIKINEFSSKDIYNVLQELKERREYELRPAIAEAKYECSGGGDRVMNNKILENFEMRAKATEDRAQNAEKALEEACKHIAEVAEPNCSNCPLVSKKGDQCPNGEEEMTDSCWEFIKEYFSRGISRRRDTVLGVSGTYEKDDKSSTEIGEGNG